MGVFHVFYIAQILPNRATHLIHDGTFLQKNITAKYVPGHGRFQQCIIF